MADGLKQRRSTSSSWEDLPVPGSTAPDASGQKRQSKRTTSKDSTLSGDATDSKRYSRIQTEDEPTAHPPGYNKKKRDIVKLILVVVAAALLRGDPKVATVLSAVSMICLKEGTLLSVKNLKWLGLCLLSFGMSAGSWYLEKQSEERGETKEYNLDSALYSAAKIIQLCWGMTLSVFLASAYMHGHNSLLEFDWVWDAEPPPSGPRTKDPPPKRYLLY